MANPLLLIAGIAALAAPQLDRDTVAQLDRSYQEAVKRNDAETMDKIMHPQFLLVLGDGRRYTREELLNDARRNRFVYELQDEEAGSQSVLVSGDTATEQLRKVSAAGLTMMHKPLKAVRLRALLNHEFAKASA